jgi:hypothetical protein
MCRNAANGGDEHERQRTILCRNCGEFIVEMPEIPRLVSVRVVRDEEGRVAELVSGE